MKKGFDVKKFIKDCLIGVVVIGGISSSTILSMVDYKQKATDLPSYNEVNEHLAQLSLNDYYYNNSYFNRIENVERIARAPLSKDNDAIALNIAFLPTSWQRECIDNVVNSLNYIFQNINPDYKFFANYNPNVSDFYNPYNIDVFKGSITKKSHYNGTPIYKENDMGFVNSKIFIKKKDFNNKANFERTFMHEILHHMGLYDEYLKEKDNTVILENSIMNSASSITQSDIKVLASGYAKEGLNQNILNFINNYTIDPNRHIPVDKKNVLSSLDNILSKENIILGLKSENMPFLETSEIEIKKDKLYFYQMYTIKDCSYVILGSIENDIMKIYQAQINNMKYTFKTVNFTSMCEYKNNCFVAFETPYVVFDDYLLAIENCSSTDEDLYGVNAYNVISYGYFKSLKKSLEESICCAEKEDMQSAINGIYKIVRDINGFETFCNEGD